MLCFFFFLHLPPLPHLALEEEPGVDLVYSLRYLMATKGLNSYTVELKTTASHANCGLSFFLPFYFLLVEFLSFIRKREHVETDTGSFRRLRSIPKAGLGNRTSVNDGLLVSRGRRTGKAVQRRQADLANTLKGCRRCRCDAITLGDTKERICTNIHIYGLHVQELPFVVCGRRRYICTRVMWVASQMHAKCTPDARLMHA